MRIAMSIAAVMAFTAPAPVVAQQAPASSVDPAATQALDNMGKYLRGLKQFEIRAESSTEEVLTDGQKVQLAGVVTYKARPPNKLFVEIASDRKVRQAYYDGASLTIFSPRMGYYTTVKAPPTIGAMIEAAQDLYNFQLPLSDLFYWGAPNAPPLNITSASVIGYAKVNGIGCTQYAFRQADVDWQLWIRDGDAPLPIKLVITSKSDPALPQYQSLFTWNTAPAWAGDPFAFKAPATAKPISIVSTGAP